MKKVLVEATLMQVCEYSISLNSAMNVDSLQRAVEKRA